MFVRMWMTTDLVTVPPETPILEAQDIMKRHGVRRLPVVNKRGKLLGIVTKSDIQEAGPSDATTLSIWELNYLLARTTVEQIMVKAEDLITVSPDDPIERAAMLMRKHKVGGLPVVEGNQLVGIITESDIFKILLELMGVYKKGSRITLELEDRPGALADALEVLREHEANVLSIVTCEECRTTPGRAVVVIKIDAYDWRKIVKDLKEKKITVLDAQNTNGWE
ncbi:MAG: CBS and ACT domain-containing protein [Candidatus Bipolaricaulota bacterium]|nr:CBS and ACT domain-containing protein [Candidatus Bipolaricaulota bacterium]MDW8110676.1 CBS and ACT domain-containing protein [Candidatus Bipolaricaulota bacterium]MDW8328466.1 CBS and ACT domain-containing protein [Candidatus Bipolaricaulota bacterium]